MTGGGGCLFCFGGGYFFLFHANAVFKERFFTGLDCFELLSFIFI